LVVHQQTEYHARAQSHPVLIASSKGTLSLDQAAALSSLGNKKQTEILMELGPSASVRKIMKAVNAEANQLSDATKKPNYLAPYHTSNTKGLLPV